MARGLVRASGGGLMLLGLGLALALYSHDPADPAWNRATAAAPVNWLGGPGAVIADLGWQWLGLAAWALILPLAGWGWRLARLDYGRHWPWTLLATLTGLPLLAAFCACFAAPADWPTQAGLGGVTGLYMLRGLEQAALALSLSVPLWVYRLGLGAIAAALAVVSVGWQWRHWQGFGLGLYRALARVLATLARIGRVLALAPIAAMRWAGRWRRPQTGGDDDEVVADQDHESASTARKPARKKRLRPEPAIAAETKAKPGKRVAAERQRRLDLGDGFTLPGLDLLTKAKAAERDHAMSREALEQNARLLESVLQDFSVKGEIIAIRPGPVVTLYELEPAPGIKSSRVIALADDIARSMSAVSARVAVVPGRNAIGIELPNARRETVFLRELLASDTFETARGQLPIVLGKTIGGEPLIADLAPMPHLLVAGTTGSGKSVAVNAMVLSLLYRLPPEACRFIMIDPKMLELSVYDGIPHLLAPVVTDPKKAIVALKWAVREMENRYQKMSKLSVRNIQAFNDKVREAQAKGGALTRRVHTGYDGETGAPVYEDLEFDFTPLPLIVLIVDELADLMIVAGKEVEAAIQRLAQMARAAGIHLILATQRPSVDVITGVIKANLPTRISFQVTSKIDSRTILESQGAEQLLGKGDMLFMQNGRRITRVHGPFVSDEEVERVVAHLKTQGMPDYIEAVTEEPEEGYDLGGDGGPAKTGDDLYDRAVALVAAEQKASTSFIQRHLQIGYNRAARLIEQMEKQGVVGPANHVGKREVLISEAGEPY